MGVIQRTMQVTPLREIEGRYKKDVILINP